MSHDSLASAGIHFVIGLSPSPVLGDSDRALLADLRPAGVLLFKSNFRHDLPYEAWLESHARLIADIRAATGREKMWIALDHEGGRVCRTPRPITRYDYAARWAANSAKIGAAMGRELSSLGINLDFAPVLDIHTNPANPVIGPRAFGETPEAVIKAALPFIEALESQGVLACGKHFPGHGDTSIDSHLGLPSQPLGLNELRARELKPFGAAIHAGLSMIMTSHILYPAVDREAPVTLSQRFLAGILRDELGFEGAAISDDIGMGAIRNLFDDAESAVRLINAGCDMLIVCGHSTDLERARGFAKAIVAAAGQGRVDAGLLARSRARIARLLAKAAPHEVKLLPESILQMHASLGPLYEEETAEVV